jgi:hypothetical protein
MARKARVMSVIEHKFRLLVIDNDYVLLLPKSGEPRRLPKKESEYAMRFLGVFQETPIANLPARVRELGRPMEDAPDLLRGNPLQVLCVLAKEARQMGHGEVMGLTKLPNGSVGSALARLVKGGLADVDKSGRFYRWSISSAGIDWLAANGQD